MMRFLRGLGRGLRYLLIGAGALAISGGALVYADYNATVPGSGTSFGSVVIGGVHYASMLICDATLGEARCAKVDASGALTVTANQGTSPWVGNTTQWASGTLGSMANYGTSPGAVLVPGVNAFVTNATPLGSAASASSSPVVIASDQAAVAVKQSGTWANVGVNVQAVASGGWSPKWFIAANSDNATNLKNSPGIVHAVQIYGISATPAWLKFYDTSTSPTCASSTIVKQLLIPANSTAANGAGNNFQVIDFQFSTGISYCVVTGIGATDDTAVAAANYVINIDWK